eukprot:Tbor_TRINITY_DN3206_c0_g1::TRINITY_DN3206_c0_g1_i1::g.23783::m.23783
MELHSNNGDNTMQQQPPSNIILQVDNFPLGDGISQTVDQSQVNSQTKPLRYDQQPQYYQGNNNSYNNNSIAGKLFVGQVPYIATEELLRPLFQPYGNIMEIKIMRDGDGRSKGCAWVRYDTQEQAQGAIEALHDKHTIPPQTNMLQVRFAQPSQGGGGRGGGRGWNNRFSGYHCQPIQGSMGGGYMGGQYSYNQGGYSGVYHQGHSGGFGGRGGNTGWNSVPHNGYTNQSGHGQHIGYFAPPSQPHQSHGGGNYMQHQPHNTIYFSNPRGGGPSNQQLWT